MNETTSGSSTGSASDHSTKGTYTHDDRKPGTGVVRERRLASPSNRMLDALLIYAEAGQAVVLTPFLLMGAMAPVSLPAALAQQLAETLAGIALVQLVRPGCPVVMGGFLSATDMQSGAPSFGDVRADGCRPRAPSHPPRALTGLLLPSRLISWDDRSTM